jgi:hypothetical protein
MEVSPVSNVTLPVIGQEPWGEDLNACLASLAAGNVSHSSQLVYLAEQIDECVVSVSALEAQGDTRASALEAQLTALSDHVATVSTQVVANTSDIDTLRADVSVIQADVALLKHRFSTVGRWQTNTQVGATPGGMQVTSDTGNFRDATWLRFAKIDQTNTEMSEMLKDATMLIVQHQHDSTMWVHMEVTGQVSVQGDYVQVPVNCIGAGVPGQAWQNVVVTMTVILGP